MKSRSRIQCSMRLLIGGTVLILVFGLLAYGGQRPRRRPAPKTQRPITSPRIDYSRFSHSTQKHLAECNTCHKVPTDNWKKVRDFPDVADYPGHSACVSCHRPQFFKGAKPPICSVCHTKVSPRDDVRFAFRNPSGRREFVIEFPHDKHQDVIAALLQRSRPAPGEARPIFQRASFTRSQEKTKHFNNCEICHGPRTTAPITPVAGWPDSFVPDAAAFKSLPISHASCFNCHWKSEQPTGENCGGCHKWVNVSANYSVLLSVNPKPTPTQSTDLGSLGLPLRLSMKFRHAREQHVAECTTCHINITKASSLRGLQPDVPITSCTECHNKDGLRLDVNKELEAVDKNRGFVCSYCHTSDVGRRDAPASHYLIAGRPALKRQDIK